MSSDERPDWCTCEHSADAHQWGLCQMVIGGHVAQPQLCPCENPNWGDSYDLVGHDQ